MSADSSAMAPPTTAGSDGPDRNDANLKLVLKALSDKRWDFRTVEGLTKATGLDPDSVREILDGHPEAIRVSAVPDRNGRALYTLRSRSPKFTEILASFRAFVSKST